MEINGNKLTNNQLLKSVEILSNGFVDTNRYKHVYKYRKASDPNHQIRCLFYAGICDYLPLKNAAFASTLILIRIQLLLLCVQTSYSHS